jgi:hypothetical protein
MISFSRMNNFLPAGQEEYGERRGGGKRLLPLYED